MTRSRPPSFWPRSRLSPVTSACWTARQAEYAAEARRQKEVDAHTVDVFQPGEMQPERDHNMQGEKSIPCRPWAANCGTPTTAAGFHSK
jgi:uncharacterized protein